VPDNPAPLVFLGGERQKVWGGDFTVQEVDGHSFMSGWEEILATPRHVTINMESISWAEGCSFQI
jgi:hypothetical protein